MNLEEIQGKLAAKQKSRPIPRIHNKLGIWFPDWLLAVLFFLILGGLVVSIPNHLFYRVSTPANRSGSNSNLRHITLAFHDYHDNHGKLPRHAIYDPNGRPLLSWRVLILPFIDQGHLYKEFRLDEPWDSPHNKPLLRKMPQIYVHPDAAFDSSKGLTHYQAFVIKPGTNPTSILVESPISERSLYDMRKLDGVSSTILIVEADKQVPWTKPEDLEFDPAGPLPKLGVNGNGALASFADGSVRNLVNFNKKELQALITVNGNEKLPEL
ncbi:MAG: DUF1559 domain-containing protein [Gemmataceae bacterium]